MKLKKVYLYTVVAASIGLTGCTTMGALARAHPAASTVLTVVTVVAAAVGISTSVKAAETQKATGAASIENSRYQNSLLEAQARAQQEANYRAQAQRQEECVQSVFRNNSLLSISCKFFSQVDTCKIVFERNQVRPPSTCRAILRGAGLRV